MWLQAFDEPSRQIPCIAIIHDSKHSYLGPRVKAHYHPTAVNGLAISAFASTGLLPVFVRMMMVGEFDDCGPALPIPCHGAIPTHAAPCHGVQPPRAACERAKSSSACQLAGSSGSSPVSLRNSSPRPPPTWSWKSPPDVPRSPRPPRRSASAFKPSLRATRTATSGSMP